MEKKKILTSENTLKSFQEFSTFHSFAEISVKMQTKDT